MTIEDSIMLLRPARARYGAICQGLVAVPARDPREIKFHVSLALQAVDVAHRISSPKLDCLSQVMPLIPDGPYRTQALQQAYDFCIADHSQDCRRLKPPRQ